MIPKLRPSCFLLIVLALLVSQGFTVIDQSLAIHGLCRQCGQKQAVRRHSKAVRPVNQH